MKYCFANLTPYIFNIKVLDLILQKINKIHYEYVNAPIILSSKYLE